MDCDFQLLPHKGIQTLSPYVPGKSIDEVVKELGLKDVIKLASNENPLGCSPHVIKELGALSPDLVSKYPAPLLHPLRQKLANLLLVEESMVTLSNGSDWLFTMLLLIFAENQNNKHMLTHDFAFITYAIQAQTLGIPIVSTPVNAYFEVDIDAMIQACTKDTAIIFIANPNNPTGVLIPIHEIKRLLDNIPSSTILVIDEAYYEFAFSKGDRGALSLLPKYPNLVVTRTFSKAYGLAGFRLGYSIANHKITELIQRVQLPFVVNQIAMAMGLVALDDENFLAETLENNQKGMGILQQGLETLRLPYIHSTCNFITFDCNRSAIPIYEKLLRGGIIVRPLIPYQLPNHLRVTIGKPEQILYFLDILRESLEC